MHLTPEEFLVLTIYNDCKVFTQGDVFDVLYLGIWTCAIFMIPEIEVAIEGQGCGVNTGFNLTNRFIY